MNQWQTYKWEIKLNTKLGKCRILAPAFPFLFFLQFSSDIQNWIYFTLNRVHFFSDLINTNEK